MKQLLKPVASKIILTVITLFAFTTYIVAQDSGSSSTSTHTETQSVSVQPWVWIVGAAVFILLLVALLRGSKK